MSEVLISIDDLSKKFNLNYKQSNADGMFKVLRSLIGLNEPFEKKRAGFHALDNVNLNIKRGETVGLIGDNGAGKSTLLKHINGIYIPDSGSVRVDGHVEGLIELGAGFHPLLTGRENILHRVSMLNVSKVEEKRIIEEIIEFSELEKFIDVPIKNYSSGMQARLGFASAVLTKPDVLLIDEVLSVGDFSFRQKCLGKINEIKNEAAIIFVSHSDQSMRMFCNRGILLANGKVAFDGGIDEALKFYFDKNTSEGKSTYRAMTSQEFLNSDKVESIEANWIRSNGQAGETFLVREKLGLEVLIKLKKRNFHKLILGVPFYREDIYLGALSNEYINYELQPENNLIKLKFEVENNFNKGPIDAFVSLYDGPECLLRKALPRLEIINHNSRVHGEFLINFNINQVKQ